MPVTQTNPQDHKWLELLTLERERPFRCSDMGSLAAFIKQGYKTEEVMLEWRQRYGHEFPVYFEREGVRKEYE
jgi:hypothetical protein